MPVYRKSRLVHIHVPKTGGTVIGKVFHEHDEMVWGEDSWVGQKYMDQRWYELQHLSLAEFNRLTGDEFSEFQSFSVIRNPYTRLISEYLWRQSQSRYQPGADMLSFETFDQFLLAIPEDIDANWDYHMAFSDQRRANFLIHVRPQHHYVCGRDGRPGLDHLFAFERLHPDLTGFLERLNLDAGAIVTPGDRYCADYFDRRALDRVNKIYRKDFALGSYALI